ncbi:hypothetical protein N44_00710 [Microcystis aeruginosa NIES-44]|uniref:Uncharacterized protein n=1 Tax=Microcystis aeruginosa NIES-44 TaxID=449439 RepID=A0A0A1VPZ5_MICAE|nr:hypothetical protein N44_00710 [Microcystis aeruginosa NIES-44]
MLGVDGHRVRKLNNNSIEAVVRAITKTAAQLKLLTAKGGELGKF